jgi:hypothetical protein
MTDSDQNTINELRARIVMLEADAQVGKQLPGQFNPPVSSFVSMSSSPDSYSFRPTINANRTSITVEAGDVVLGPGTWQEIAESTPAVTSTDTHVWLEIKVDGSTTPVMQVGTKAAMMAAMTTSATTMAYPLIETVWASGKITKARRLLDAIIPRAAG